MINWSDDSVTDKIEFLTELKMLNAISHLFGELEFPHTVITRNLICRDADIQDSTFKKNLHNLTDKGLLIKVSRGVYKINKDILTNE